MLKHSGDDDVYIGASVTSPCSMSCGSIIFSKWTSLSVCKEQSIIVLATARIVWGFPWELSHSDMCNLSQSDMCNMNLAGFSMNQEISKTVSPLLAVCQLLFSLS